MKKIMLMLMVVVGLFASNYKCVSVKKQIDGKTFKYSKDLLYGIEKGDTLKIALKNTKTHKKVDATFYRADETMLGKFKFKIYKNDGIRVFVSETPTKNELYFITLETDEALEGFFCVKSK